MRVSYCRHLDWAKTNKKAVHRWRAKNNINGLVYGNGGLVGWAQGHLPEHEDTRKCRNRRKSEWISVGECLMKIYTTVIQPQSLMQHHNRPSWQVTGKVSR